ncbi:hypothetical protein LguiB_023690 [Lonicera macranthoides]
MSNQMMDRNSSSSSAHLNRGGGMIKMIRGVIMGVIGIVFVGYVLIWIVMPTAAYGQQWRPKIFSATNSTYFGSLQGSRILLNTAPMLFIAVLGSVYLHLGEKVSDVNTQRGEAKLERVALTLGIVGNICLVLLFYPVTRGSSVLPLIGLTSDGSIKYHIWLGHLSMFLFTFHGFLYLTYWSVTRRFSQSVRLISARILPCKTVELNFAKNPGLSYAPTSIMFINVPSISKLQWHPFTINSSSNLEPEILSVIIKCEGSWTNKLCQMLALSPSIDHLDVSVEGPYGPTSTHFLRHELLVMVSGGSGISPFISIIRDLMFTNSTLQQNTPKILLVSAFKNSLDLAMLDFLLPFHNPTSQSPNLDLQIEAYVTREKGPSNPNCLRAIWFNPRRTDEPISPTLGQNNWLWLGAIVTFSFLIYLLLIGVITRFYIYPIDHNSNKIYPHSLRTLFNMLIICISIVMTASAAFIWNKKQNATEMREGLKQGSLVGHDERELESFPQQSLAKSIKVHYGERPDLKRIISECRGSSIGVLVCGPQEMRHDVAHICSSGVTENLHFESISFSW